MAHFRQALRLAGTVLLLEAASTLPLHPMSIETPLCPTTVPALNTEANPLWVIPILRAGLCWNELALELLPHAHVWALGMARNEATLEPECYYPPANKTLPSSLQHPGAQVWLVDPMLATAGSALATLRYLEAKGLKVGDNVTFVGLLASQQGVDALRAAYPQVRLVLGAVDATLNEKGYIVPGLGDAGDRYFGT